MLPKVLPGAVCGYVTGVLIYAIAGLSMGGFHSKFISLNNPDTFDYVGLFSAALGVTDPSISPIYQNEDARSLSPAAHLFFGMIIPNPGRDGNKGLPGC